LEALQNETADRQTDAIENFLRAVAAHQSDRVNEYTSIRQAALDAEIDLLENAPLPEMKTPLLSDDDQLRVTNLRLQLLRSIQKTDEQRAKAREELNTILSNWQTRIRVREKERQAELQRIRVEIPRQKRAEGEKQIKQEIESLRRQDRAAQSALMREHRARVLADFGGDAARLGFTLPEVFAPAPGLAPAPEAGGEDLFDFHGSDLIETNFKMPSSAPALERFAPVRVAGLSGMSGYHLPPANRAALVRSLRGQAWHDARVQAQMAARRFGWDWKPQKAASGATDRTRETLQWLFG
jgi:hypothetical protein